MSEQSDASPDPRRQRRDDAGSGSEYEDSDAPSVSEVAKSESYQSSALVPSGEASEASQRDWFKGIAQRITEPFAREREEKGDFLFVERKHRTGKHYYQDEFGPESARLDEKHRSRVKDIRRARAARKGEMLSSDEETPRARAKSKSRRPSRPQGDDGAPPADQPGPSGVAHDGSGAGSAPPSKPSSKPPSERAPEDQPGATTPPDEQQKEGKKKGDKRPEEAAEKEEERPRSEPRRSGSAASEASAAPAPREGSGEHAPSGDEAPVRRARSQSRRRPPAERAESYGSELQDEAAEAAERESLSSGIMPRDGPHARPPRPGRRPWTNVHDAEAEWAYMTEKLVDATNMRRKGLNPANFGAPDDMNSRLAYEQLLSLEGMNKKVQETIEHNRKAFEARIMMEERQLMVRVWDGWMARVHHKQSERGKLLRAVNKIRRGALARAFYKWRDEYKLQDKTHAVRKKLAAVHDHGRKKRCFEAWVGLCEERRWRQRVESRDRDVRTLERTIKKLENRAVVVTQKRRLRAAFMRWKEIAVDEIARENKMQQVAGRFRNRLAARAWASWVEHTEAEREKKRRMRHVVNVLQKGAMTRAFDQWRSLVGLKEAKKEMAAKALTHWKNKELRRAWDGWRGYLEWKQKKRQAVLKWKNGFLAAAFDGFAHECAERRRRRILVERSVARIQRGKLIAAWEAWQDAVHETKATAFETHKEKLADEVAVQRAENERLRRDNERLVRIIDSGEWGRGRVQELAQAGEILAGEREAMMRLVDVLRREYESLQIAKEQQEAEVKALKERFLTTGHARNVMLVRGGSSFNSLVRAMKQDVADAAQPGGSGRSRPGSASRRVGGRSEGQHPGGPRGDVRDPNLLYEIDRLSLDRVAVFPDGELKVQAVQGQTDAQPHVGSRLRPTGAGPVQRARIPENLSRHAPEGYASGGDGRAPRAPEGGVRSSADRIAASLGRLGADEIARLDSEMRGGGYPDV